MIDLYEDQDGTLYTQTRRFTGPWYRITPGPGDSFIVDAANWLAGEPVRNGVEVDPPDTTRLYLIAAWSSDGLLIERGDDGGTIAEHEPNIAYIKNPVGVDTKHGPELAPWKGITFATGDPQELREAVARACAEVERRYVEKQRTDPTGGTS